MTLEKFHPKNLKRGLDEGQSPFPVMPKIGPYVVSTLFQIFDNLYDCRSKTQCSVPKTTIIVNVACQRSNHSATPHHIKDPCSAQLNLA